MGGASGSMQDATPYGNNGTGPAMSPTRWTGMIGKAQDFDGNGDWFSGGSSSTMDVSADDKVTLSAWVRRDGAGVTGHEKVSWASSNGAAGDFRCYGLDYDGFSGFKFLLSSTGTSGTETQLISHRFRHQRDLVPCRGSRR